RAVADTAAFHWNISSWNALFRRTTSTTFHVAGRRWKIIVFPNGNDSPGNVSLYLCYIPSGTSSHYVDASFALAISNHRNPANVLVNSTTHAFAPEGDDWGFTNFVEKKTLKQRHSGHLSPLVQHGFVRISAYVRVYCRTEDLLPPQPLPITHAGEEPDEYLGEPVPQSRFQTDHIGLVSDSDSLYLNSLVLALYHIPQFRRAIERISDSGSARMAVGTAMQDLFRCLALDESPPSTAALVAAIHDQSDESPATSTVQHYLRLLCECLARRMADTPDESLIDCMFMGSERSTTECLHVPYSNSRSEPIYDLSLNINHVSTLYQAIEQYCEPEPLDGNNKYRTSEYGYQDAVRFSCFESLPPVLHVYLNRFEYDLDTGDQHKNPKWNQYPESLDMDKFMADSADRSMSWTYILHAVLLHTGNMSSGHYYCLVRSYTTDEWLCYEDDLVYPVPFDFVVDVTNDIADGTVLSDSRVRDHQETSRFENAYALVYIRDSLLPQICGSEESLPLPVPYRELRAPSILSQGSMYMPSLTVYLIDNKQTARHQGFDLCNHPNIDGPPTTPLIELTFLLTTSPSDFMLQACSALGRSPTEVRFWHMANRANKTLRCDTPVDLQSTTAVRDLIKAQGSAYNAVYLYCELRKLSDPVYFFKSVLPDAIIMLHLKFYDPVRAKITGLGHIYVAGENRGSDSLRTGNVA
ncbi:ubiquitin-specific protease ubp15, partial [Linderina macrospora]